MLPGDYPVTITDADDVTILDADGNDVTAGYDVTCEDGLMRIAPVATPIRVTAASAKREYDGTPLADARFSYNQGALVAGDALEATVEGSATHVGDAGANVVTSVRVMRGDLDVTGAYTLAQSVPGRLEVTPRALTVATGSASKAFDGTPLTAPEARLEGLVAGETATVVATGSLTLPGSARNGYDLRWDGTAREADYEVTEEDLGTLTVTAPTAVSYRYAGVADPTWTHGQTTPLTLTYKRSVADETTLDHFTGIRVDGTEVDARWYAARRGSVVIDLSATFLEGLATGSHEAMALFDDGTAPRVTFHVRDAGQDTPVVPVVPSNPPFPFVPTTPVAPHGPWLPPVSPYAPVRPSDPGQPSANGAQRSPDSPASPAAPTAPAQPTVPPTTGGTDGGATTSVPVATEAPASDGTGSATVQSTSRPATKSAGVTRSVLGRRPSEETDDAEATVPQNVPATSDAQGPGLALALAGCGAVLAGSASRRWRRE